MPSDKMSQLTNEIHRIYFIPGSTEGVAMTENMIEHIAKVTGKDPVDVRLANMDETDKAALQPMIEDLKKSSDFDTRRAAVKTFNNVSETLLLLIR